MRMRKKPNLDKRLERCAHLLVAEPGLFRGVWRSGSGYAALHVELGCGKGRFTAGAAIAEGGVLLVALEKSADAMVTAVERAAAEGVRNVRFVNAYADRLLDFFAPGEVSRIFINFCDPWPANRHAKRRLTGRRFLELYAQVLCPGGDVLFKTDNLALFEFSLREFEFMGFEAAEVVRDLHRGGPVGVMTDYELKFHSLGAPIYMCRVVYGGAGPRYP